MSHSNYHSARTIPKIGKKAIRWWNIRKAAMFGHETAFFSDNVCQAACRFLLRISVAEGLSGSLHFPRECLKRDSWEWVSWGTEARRCGHFHQHTTCLLSGLKHCSSLPTAQYKVSDIPSKSVLKGHSLHILYLSYFVTMFKNILTYQDQSLVGYAI